MIITLVADLVDRIIQLIEHQKKVKRELFNNFVKPVYTEFEKVHDEYLKSFREYRHEISSLEGHMSDISVIIDRIYEDNLFSDSQRTKILSLAGYVEESIVGKFVQSIYDYLIDIRVAKVPIREKPEGQQVWRNSLRRELDAIFSENWNVVLDPFASRPPLTEDETNKELDFLYDKHKISRNDPARLDKLKIALSKQTINRLVEEMQASHGNITQEYLRLKKNLIKEPTL